MYRCRKPPILPSAYPYASFSSKRRIRIMSDKSRFAASASTPKPEDAASLRVSVLAMDPPLPTHDAQLVHRQPPADAEDRHDDRQSDGDLGRRHRHHEEHDGLAVEIADALAEGDQREIRRV